MSDQRILEKAIQKALLRGWDIFGAEEWEYVCSKCGKRQGYGSDFIKLAGNYHSEDGGKWQKATHKPRFVVTPENRLEFPYVDMSDKRSYYASYTLYEVIFSHDFASAVWGEEPYRTVGELGQYQTIKEVLANISNWQYHLQWMVTSDDPLTYLGANL